MRLQCDFSPFAGGIRYPCWGLNPMNLLTNQADLQPIKATTSAHFYTGRHCYTCTYSAHVYKLFIQKGFPMVVTHTGQMDKHTSQCLHHTCLEQSHK